MNWNEVGQIGYVLALSLSAVGSALGTHAAGMAAVGAWKKCLLDNRPPPFILVSFVGAPLSQTIYGMILMNTLRAAPETAGPLTLLAAGLFGGGAIGLSAWLQGQVGAAASDALASTGKGFGHFIMALGIIETVALFVMVFLMTVFR